MTGKGIAWITLWTLLLVGLGGGAWYVSRLVGERQREQDRQLAQSLFEQGKLEQAQALVDQRIEKMEGDERWAPDWMLLHLEVLSATDPAAAAQAAEAILANQKLTSKEPRRQAHLLLGQAALDGGNADEAQRHFDAALTISGPNGAGAEQARLGMLRIQMAGGLTYEIRDKLQALYNEFPNSPHRPEIEYVLGEANLKLLLSPLPSDRDQIYAVQRGDSVYTIARKHKISQDLLLHINNIRDPRMLSIGRRLKIPNVDFAIEVDKTNNTLTVYNHGEFFKRYPVRTGRYEYLTPVGEYKIISKKKDPQWNDPQTHRVVPPGDPENELGTRWMGFQGSSLGIHGTIHPETIGSYASNGCVGLLKEDVEELYDLIQIGTPVKIFGETQAEATVSMAS